jgi:branched-chain amino acid transport system ATP-binding protein
VLLVDAAMTIEALVAETPSASLLVRDVSVMFGGLAALAGVSLTVGLGEVVGVIGPNGAGKTTLFNVVCGFVSPRTGSIVVDGREVRHVRPHQLAKLGVARTLQGVGLWPGLTVLENVMAGAQVSERPGLASALLGLPRSSRAELALVSRAMSTLEDLDVASFADRLPSTLSFAVQKRVALARALVCSPRILLLDEPASGLSNAELFSMGELLVRLKQRMGVLLVDHHMDFVMAACDRVVVLDSGTVIATGTPDEVKRNPAVAEAYLGEELDNDSSVKSIPRKGDDVHG